MPMKCTDVRFEDLFLDTERMVREYDLHQQNISYIKGESFRICLGDPEYPGVVYELEGKVVIKED